MIRVTESFHKYKGYTIRLRAVLGNGFWYSVIKTVPNSLSPNGIKKLYLRNIGYNFIEPEELLEKAKKYIDNYSDILEKKYNNKIKTLKNE